MKLFVSMQVPETLVFWKVSLDFPWQMCWECDSKHLIFKVKGQWTLLEEMLYSVLVLFLAIDFW